MGTGADDETRTRDPHLGKVMRYQLRYIRMRSTLSALNARTNLIRILAAVTNRHVTAILRGLSANYVGAICSRGTFASGRRVAGRAHYPR